jgi:hypothetical protein
MSGADTNLIVRFLVRDVEDQAQKVRNLLIYLPFTSDTLLTVYCLLFTDEPPILLLHLVVYFPESLWFFPFQSIRENSQMRMPAA